MNSDNHQQRLRGLYVITDQQLIGGERLLPAIAAAIAGGARLVQYRDKSNDSVRRLREAGQLLQLCRQADVPLIINDDIQLASDIGADGVHLGRHDGSVADARAALGNSAIIGLSCYDDTDLASEADIDYAAFGRFFPSSTKPDAPPVTFDILQRARATLSIPIAAIGGITIDNGARLRDAGADMLAVVAGVFNEDNIQTAAQALAALYPDT